MPGKWHVSKTVMPNNKSNWSRQRGFYKFFGTITGADNYYEPVILTMMNEPVKAQPGFYYTDAISDTAFMLEKVSGNWFPCSTVTGNYMIW